MNSELQPYRREILEMLRAVERYGSADRNRMAGILNRALEVTQPGWNWNRTEWLLDLLIEDGALHPKNEVTA